MKNVKFHRRPGSPARDGSVLVITLWVALGLVSLALYFGQSMSLELRAADQRVAAFEADHAIDGATRYATYVLSQVETSGVLPEPTTYSREAVPVGQSLFWFIGRDPQVAANAVTTRPYFALVDESSKLNINTATVEMLQGLPGMTAEIAAAIVDWRDTDSTVTSTGGAEDDTYLLRNPASHCKNGPFETLDELRLVYGMDLLLLYGEDTNLNGVMDANENDGDASPPEDNRNGRLDPGFFEYLTAYSRIPNTTTNGTARVNITQNGFVQQLRTVLQTVLSTDRATQILRNFNGPNVTVRSLPEFYTRSRMTLDEFVQIEEYLTLSAGQYMTGLVNVNTASEAVLACIPGIGADKASSLVAYRQSNPDKRKTVAWVTEVLDNQSLAQAGRFLTGRSYQYTADIAAVGHYGRGYRRSRVVFETSSGVPQILYRQDLGSLGWALGQETRQKLSTLTANLR